MLQRLLDTESLSGKQWGVTLLLSLLAPAFVWIDKQIQISRQRKQQQTLGLGGPSPVEAAVGSKAA
jgi:hypothetical protein